MKESRRRHEVEDLRATLAALPKVDLHRHLEGSLRLETLCDIALEHGIDLPSYDIESLRPLVTVTDEKPDYRGFLEKFAVLRRFYPTRDAVERVAREAIGDAAADNVKYLELRFNPVALARLQGFGLPEVTEWVCSAAHSAERENDIDVRLILQIGRDEPLATAYDIADIAAAHQGGGVVGLDLAGDEVDSPAAAFADVFRHARDSGLGLTLHAGEAGGADNVLEAISLGAQRIGHGIGAAGNPQALKAIRDGGITLEMCPTSNLQTGAVRSLAEHPLTEMLGHHLRVTVNTDDPSISDTTLTDEYLVAALAMGVSLAQIKTMILNSVEGSFLPQAAKARMLGWFTSALRAAPYTQPIMERESCGH
jgi:adenosine deaminase